MSTTGRSQTSGVSDREPITTVRASDAPPPKVGYGDHKLRGRRGLDVDTEDLARVQRQELRSNLVTSGGGGVRRLLRVQDVHVCRSCDSTVLQGPRRKHRCGCSGNTGRACQ